MHEREAFELCLRLSRDFGVEKHWHKPYVRFGVGTTMTFYEPLQEDHVLRPNDPVYIDLGPAWFDPDSGAFFEGDVGNSFVYGENPEALRCAATARELFEEVEQAWKERGLSGNEIFQLMKHLTSKKGYLLTEKVQGHRISDFPHQRYSKERLAGLEFRPSNLLWVLEVHLRHPSGAFGAFFEDVLGVNRSDLRN